MSYSRGFIRFNWLTLVLIYLVVIAGSFVRISGSGMGCPDWPKCFGQWVPPTEASELPEDYKEIYAAIREKKIRKFSRFLRNMGSEGVADRLENDPDLRLEQDFNARKTWTEYANRLVGFLAGNAMLFAFIWILARYRKRKLILITGINLVFMAFQAWFGSIVVASNLVPWTITVHMFLALLIIALQLYLLRQISPSQQENMIQKRWMIVLIWICFAITFYQMFLGTQVRESIDMLSKQWLGRESWIEQSGIPFLIHRSFSWLVFTLLAIIAYKNEQTHKYKPIRWLFILLLAELISGVLLAYTNMPGLVQTAHLLFATVIFGILVMVLFRGKVRGQLVKGT